MKKQFLHAVVKWSTCYGIWSGSHSKLFKSGIEMHRMHYLLSFLYTVKLLLGDICKKTKQQEIFLTDFDLSFNQNNIKYFTMTNNIIKKINRHVIDWYGTMGCTFLLHLIRLFLQYITALLLIVFYLKKYHIAFILS